MGTHAASIGRGLYTVCQQGTGERWGEVLALNMEERVTSVGLKTTGTSRRERRHQYRYPIPYVRVLCFPNRGFALAEPVCLTWEFRVLWARMVNSWAWTSAFSVLQCTRVLFCKALAFTLKFQCPGDYFQPFVIFF